MRHRTKEALDLFYQRVKKSRRKRKEYFAPDLFRTKRSYVKSGKYAGMYVKRKMARAAKRNQFY